MWSLPLLYNEVPRITELVERLGPAQLKIQGREWSMY
jgi:hypothetical protein